MPPGKAVWWYINHYYNFAIVSTSRGYLEYCVYKMNCNHHCWFWWTTQGVLMGLLLCFCFRVEGPTDVFMLVLWCLISTFRFRHSCSLHQWGITHLGLHHDSPFGAQPWQAYVPPSVVALAVQECTRCGAFLCFKKGISHATQTAVSPALPSIWWDIQFWGLSELLNPSAFPTWWGGGSSFPVWYCLMTQSTLNQWWMVNLVLQYDDWLWGSWINLDPCQWNILLLDYKFTTHSLVRCHLDPTACMQCVGRNTPIQTKLSKKLSSV